MRVSEEEENLHLVVASSYRRGGPSRYVIASERRMSKVKKRIGFTEGKSVRTSRGLGVSYPRVQCGGGEGVIKFLFISNVVEILNP